MRRAKPDLRVLVATGQGSEANLHELEQMGVREVLLKPDSRLLQSIHEGRPNTAMDAWQSAMSDEAIRDVLAYVLTFPR